MIREKCYREQGNNKGVKRGVWVEGEEERSSKIRTERLLCKENQDIKWVGRKEQDESWRDEVGGGAWWGEEEEEEESVIEWWKRKGVRWWGKRSRGEGGWKGLRRGGVWCYYCGEGQWLTPTATTTPSRLLTPPLPHPCGFPPVIGCIDTNYKVGILASHTPLLQHYLHQNSIACIADPYRYWCSVI